MGSRGRSSRDCDRRRDQPRPQRTSTSKTSLPAATSVSSCRQPLELQPADLRAAELFGLLGNGGIGRTRACRGIVFLRAYRAYRRLQRLERPVGVRKSLARVHLSRNVAPTAAAKSREFRGITTQVVGSVGSIKIIRTITDRPPRVAARLAAACATRRCQGHCCSRGAQESSRADVKFRSVDCSYCPSFQRIRRLKIRHWKAHLNANEWKRG